MSRRVTRAEDRLRRLLVMLPWLMEVEEVPLADVASRFGMTEDEVVRDLELVAMCGLPPYVDEMIDVFVDEGMVFVGVPRLFRRQLRLTAPEAFSLLAAARTALELPGADADGALRRGLARLAEALRDVGVSAGADESETALDGSGDPTVGVEVDLERPEFADAVTDAVADGAELEIDYFSPARDEISTRRVIPRHVFVDRGNWYVRASAGGGSVDDGGDGEREGSGDATRTFRIDRIERLARTGVTVEVDPSLAEPAPFFADREVPRATLRLAPGAAWVVDRYPFDSVEPVDVDEPSRGLLVTLPVASERWLARLLVRLGPDASVVEPAESSETGAELARAVLARYRVAG